MRLVSISLLALVVVACSDDKPSVKPDAQTLHHDGGVDADLPCGGGCDAPNDAAIDAPPDGAPTPSDRIAAARAAADGTALTLPIENAIVTYLKPQIGSLTNDPAGFTIQADMMGPALFVAIDPMTLTPLPTVGDTVSFTITAKATTGGQPRVTALSDFTRSAQGFVVSGLVQSVTTATDLLTAQDSYDSELLSLTGSITSAFSSSGSGWMKATFSTTGMVTDPNLQFRVPAPLVDAMDLLAGCTFTVNGTPMGRFNLQTQITAFAASEITLASCPAPRVVSATALSATEVRLTFSKNVLASSVMANGSQFTFDNGLVATAASVSARTVTVTTAPQIGGTTYTVTVANTVTDLQGTGLDAAATSTTFVGFSTPAIVRINEINANIGPSTGATACDLIELRVITAGSMNGIRITERVGATGELDFTFPATPAFNVLKNDIIVIHHNSASLTCNPDAATAEMLTPIDQPSLTSYTTAYDFYVLDVGLTNTDNVITVFAAVGGILDGVILSDAATGTAAGGSETAAASLANATPAQWQVNTGLTPPAGGFVDDGFSAHAVLDLDATGATSTGDSIQRLDDTDDNDKADWNSSTITVQPHTFGLRNVGQSAL